MDVSLRRYALYLVRWQLSTPLLAVVLIWLDSLGALAATVVANLIGGLIFFWVDRFIFTSSAIDPSWEVREQVHCADCGAVSRGYRLVRSGGTTVRPTRRRNSGARPVRRGRQRSSGGAGSPADSTELEGCNPVDPIQREGRDGTRVHPRGPEDLVHAVASGQRDRVSVRLGQVEEERLVRYGRRERPEEPLRDLWRVCEERPDFISMPAFTGKPVPGDLSDGVRRRVPDSVGLGEERPEERLARTGEERAVVGRNGLERHLTER